MIEFATLGEYGLEYPEPVRESSRRKTTPDIRMERISRILEGRQDSRATAHTGVVDEMRSAGHRHGAGPQKHRHGRRPCRPGRTRVDLPGWGDRPGHEIPGVQPDRRHKAEARKLEVRAQTESRKARRNRPTADFPEVLRPPRIRLEAA
jgi:hypothetical protein